MGTRYEIDSTIADVTLVSSTNSKDIVGRPTLYIVTDAYSGLIAGVSVSLDDPQYKCAADALYSAFTDKAEQCAKAGVELQEGEWPAIGIPLEIVADNGELQSWKIEEFGRHYGVLASLTSPYRADQKGSVESMLGAIQNTLRGLTPGVPEKKKSKKAGYHEKRTQAVLTLAEYRQLVIRAALQANRRIRSVSPPGLGFPVPKTPLRIWKRAEQMGKVNLWDPGDLNKLRKLLLPQVKCTVSQKGLLAEGIRYGCEDAQEAGLFDRQPQEGQPHGGVLFHDPADVSEAWYCPDPEATPEISWPCRLAPESQFLKGLCWTEAQKC